MNLNSRDIMSAKEAAERWGFTDDSVIRRRISEFPRGTSRKFGKQWVVTSEGMRAVFPDREELSMEIVEQRREFVSALKELKGKDVSLLDFDNTLSPISQETSIFEYGKSDWDDWKWDEDNKSSFSYRAIGNDDLNVICAIVEDNGLSFDTIVKVTDWDWV